MKKILFNCLFLFSFLTSQNVTSAVKATSNPVMDGDVLNDLAWNDVPAVTTFIQKTPDEGDSVSENTVVKVMYSDKIFYVSVVVEMVVIGVVVEEEEVLFINVSILSLLQQHIRL